MKAILIELLKQALTQAELSNALSDEMLARIQIDRTRQPEHGEFASNCAMMFCKAFKMSSRDLAEKIVQNLPNNEFIEKTAIAGPGFINFYLTPTAKRAIIKQILSDDEKFGQSTLASGKTAMIEFVSSNPTGPLHVGHGRGAAYGSTLSTLLEWVGYKVHREYYVNDAGRQMDILTTSIWLRYLELFEQQFTFPSNGYKGDYVFDIAAQVKDVHQSEYFAEASEVFADIPADEPQGGDKEIHIDALIERCKAILGEDNYRTIFAISLNIIVSSIKDDLKAFKVEFDEWFSERSLFTDNLIDDAAQRLKDKNLTFEKEGALWFKATEFGDDKDRVLVRANGQPTYFASDVAYHMNKFDRQFDEVINVFGADHHGYIPRLNASLTALGFDIKKFNVPIIQFATLYRSGEQVQMSTRSGSYVTLKELIDEVGTDAARFFYVERKHEQHMDFDLDLAKSQDKDNHVYYIQYAHARICNVFLQAKQKDILFEARAIQDDDLLALTESHELQLIDKLARFPEIIESAATHKEPHQLAYYLHELACALHAFYNEHKCLVDDERIRNARLALLYATRIVIRNGLTILGISAPEAM